MTATATLTANPLTATDRCDRCGARGAVRVMMTGGGELVFCAHHARAFDSTIREVAVEIIEARVDEAAVQPAG